MKSRRKFHYTYDKFEEGREAYLFSETREESTAALCKMLHCARCGFPTIMREFGFFLQVAFDSPSAAKLADYYIHRAAEEGDAAATMELIEQYWCKDRATARQWITRARRAGMHKALHDMALRLHEEEPELTLHIFSAIPQRDTIHSLTYAELLAIDTPDKARRLLRNTLHDKSPDEQHHLLCTLCDNAEPVIAAEARALLVRLAGKGHTMAQHKLGYCYYHGRHGFSKELRRAFRWWKRAAANRHAASMFELSLMYEHGEGIRCNRKKAFQYAEAAAAENHLRGVANLGYYHYWGIGTRRDYTAAVACFRRAIELGDTTVSAHNLAERYYHGEGVEKDIQQALYYHRMAARRNYPDSICRLGYMALHGEGGEPNKAKGIHYLNRAAKLGSARALCELGKCYEFGTGVPLNWKKAMEYYTRAAEQGCRYTRKERSRLQRKMEKAERQISR